VCLCVDSDDVVDGKQTYGAWRESISSLLVLCECSFLTGNGISMEFPRNFHGNSTFFGISTVFRRNFRRFSNFFKPWNIGGKISVEIPWKFRRNTMEIPVTFRWESLENLIFHGFPYKFRIHSVEIPWKFRGKTKESKI
jgi:hypothetical protein